MSEQSGKGELPSRDHLVLDLIGLTDEEKAEGAILLGGNAAKFVGIGDQFEYSQVGTVVFEWGDPKAEDIFAVLIEHNDESEEIFFPFCASTVIGDHIWMLAIQSKKFDPHLAYSSDDQYVVLPFGKAMDPVLQDYLNRPTPRPELLGMVGQRWVAFECGINIRRTPNEQGSAS